MGRPLRTRTELTSPPGRPPSGVALDEDDEGYVPGFAAPVEPGPPGSPRRRPLLVAGIATVGVVAAAVVAGLRLLGAV